eukprot:TRINITY_DN1933_c0_g2_i1.p1 TRINITY_DN1933_c0_g2~~TRINITY_DN1933_c0_g2_i1.p1  ORF type:complete len:226 (+),score=62.80 TRINITY_DN1933_c0_g2_i1:30-707(+)
MQNVNSNSISWTIDFSNGSGSNKKRKIKPRSKVRKEMDFNENDMKEVKDWLDSIIICVANQVVIQDNIDVLEDIESFRSKTNLSQLLNNNDIFSSKSTFNNSSIDFTNFIPNPLLNNDTINYPFSPPLQFEFFDKMNMLTKKMEESAKMCKQKFSQYPIYMPANGEFHLQHFFEEFSSVDNSLPPLIRPTSGFSCCSNSSITSISSKSSSKTSQSSKKRKKKSKS